MELKISNETSIAKQSLAKIFGTASALAAAASILLYMAVYTHVPLSLQLYQTYDDALFIRLGESLANGHWLGSFNQLTLVKGAGYPIFLALSSWMGSSVTFSQASLYCASAFVFSFSTYKMSGSKALSSLTFLLVLFNPNVFQDRVLRESIYTSQVMLVLGLSWIFIFNRVKKSVLPTTICAGLMLGWFWITREEGVWILPGIVVFFVARLIDNHLRHAGQSGTFVSGGVFFVSFASVLMALKCANFLLYGAFVGVDVKDPSFTSAMRQLQRAHVGPELSYVPLSKETRERLYELSPAFSVLKPTLDPSLGVNPSVGTECWIWPSACHDFSAGQLFWQIRNGAAKAGKFESEDDARKYFRELAKEVAGICERREIPCYDASPVAMMPHLSPRQIGAIGPSVVAAWDMLLQRNPKGWIDAPPSNGSDEDLDLAKRFLNFPLSTSVTSSQVEPDRLITLSGWYFEHEDDWFTADVPAGVEISVTRMESPDIAKAFPKAVKQRFRISLKCGDVCDVKFVSLDGDVFVFDPNASTVHRGIIHYGRSVIAFDDITIQNRRPTFESRVFAVSRDIRVALFRLYSWMVTPLVYLGILAAIVMVTFNRRYFLYSKTFVFSLALAAVILSRVAILIVINISSFPAMTSSYFSPILCLVPAWAAFSIWGVVEASGLRKERHL
ncbi:MAG: hypothetical protein EPN56_04645 [Rhodanobacter sp.]|nr:MAG: hypothetical protein EPN56_04645 [Rhodanobacter sp.]